MSFKLPQPVVLPLHERPFLFVWSSIVCHKHRDVVSVAECISFVFIVSVHFELCIDFLLLDLILYHWDIVYLMVGLIFRVWTLLGYTSSFGHCFCLIKILDYFEAFKMVEMLILIKTALKFYYCWVVFWFFITKSQSQTLCLNKYL